MHPNISHEDGLGCQCTFIKPHEPTKFSVGTRRIFEATFELSRMVPPDERRYPYSSFVSAYEEMVIIEISDDCRTNLFAIEPSFGIPG